MCHLQSSSPIFPNAVEIPPCAADVWLLVGKTFEIHAVFNPASERPTAALNPEPPVKNYNIVFVINNLICTHYDKLNIPKIVKTGTIIANIFNILFATFFIFSFLM